MIDKKKIEEAVTLMLESIGEDPNRPGLVDTPKRVARMYEELAAGYEEDVTKHLSKTFPAQNSEIVIEKDILFYSLCEHHLLPFFGKVHIAYVPNEKVVGISKLARTVEVYARRLQIQEQMTTQIADSIDQSPMHQGCHGHDRGRTYVYDNAWNQKRGQQNGDVCYTGMFLRRSRTERTVPEYS